MALFVFSIIAIGNEDIVLLYKSLWYSECLRDLEVQKERDEIANLTRKNTLCCCYVLHVYQQSLLTKTAQPWFSHFSHL